MVEVQIDFLCNDDRGEPVEFNYMFQRSELEKLTAPLIRKTVNICRETLSGRRLDPSAISKVILVGGPTLMPVFRAQLGDATEGLGVALEFNVDPLTVVARGAAVFAGNQRLTPDPELEEKSSSGAVWSQTGLRTCIPGYPAASRRSCFVRRSGGERFYRATRLNLSTRTYAPNGEAVKSDLDQKEISRQKFHLKREKLTMFGLSCLTTREFSRNCSKTLFK